MDTLLSARPGDAPASPEPQIRHASWGRSVWHRFRRHPLALLGAALLAFMALIAFLGPSVAPAESPIIVGQGVFSAQQQAEAAHRNTPPQIWPPSWRYLLGTDGYATPTLRNVLIGGSAPLTIGILGGLLATLIGIVSGAIAGYLGGWTDTIWMRLTDAFLAIPLIPLLLLATTSLSVGATTTSQYVILFGLLGWPQAARLMRGYVLSMREWDFVQAARALGVPEASIVFRHIVPNVLGLMVVAFTLNIAVFIATEVSIEFLGAPAPGMTWGAVLATGLNDLLAGSWWIAIFPALAVLLTILGVNLLGDGLRDAVESLEMVPASEAERTGKVVGGILRISAPLGAVGTVQVRRLYSLAGSLAGAVPSPADLAPLASLHLRRWLHPLERLAQQRREVPRLLTVGPIALVFLISGAAFLLGHAPLTYAPNYVPPVHYATVDGETDFGAQPLPAGGWALLSLDPQRRLVYQRMTRQGTVLFSRTLFPTPGATDLDLAANGRRSLGIWLSGNGQTLRAAYPHRAGLAAKRATFTIISGVSIEHPSIFPAPAGGFDVLWEQSRGDSYDLFLAVIPPRAKHATLIRRLVRASAHAFGPHGTVDGSGNLDITYLNLCCNRSYWDLLFRRFTPLGRPLGRPTLMTQITSLSSPGAPARDPARWGIDVERAPDGSVWAAGMGDYGVYLGHWSRTGKQLLQPQPVACGTQSCAGPDTHYLSLALLRHGGFAYFLVRSQTLGSHPNSMRFDENGVVNATQRLSYQGGGGAFALRAGPSGHTAAAIWEKIPYTGRALLEGTWYRPKRAPDLAERLGLNIGPVWVNLGVVILGSLVGGLPIAAVNVFLFALLFVLWLAIGRLLPRSLRWPIYLLGMLGILIWIFSGSLAGIIFVLHVWPAPWDWIAVLGAVIAGAWAGMVLVRHQDPPIRAAVTVGLALYFIAVMTALILIQAELAQV